MRREEVPIAIEDIERMLLDYQVELSRRAVPDGGGSVRGLIEGNLVGGGVRVGVAEYSTEDATLPRSEFFEGDGMTPPDSPPETVDLGRMVARRSDVFKLVGSSVAALIVLGALLIVFRPGAGRNGGTGDQSGMAQVSSAVVVTSPGLLAPFPLLAITTPPGQQEIVEVQPVDALTLEPLPGYEQLGFEVGRAGGYVEHAASPDGERVAFFVHRPENLSPGGRTTLHILDLNSWRDEVVTEWEHSGSSSTMRPQFSALGDTLYWVMKDGADQVLVSYEFEGSSRAQLLTLPPDFGVLEFVVSPEGDDAHFFGTPVSPNLPIDDGYVLGDFPCGNAEVLVADLGSGAITAKVVLDSVVAGSVPVQDAEGDNFPVHSVMPGLFWDLDGQRLFVAHADGLARATVVDLADGVVLDEFAFDEGASWIDRSTAWLLPPANAAASAISLGFATYLEGRNELIVAPASERMTVDRQELEIGIHNAVWSIDLETGEQLWQSHLLGVIGLEANLDGSRLLVHSTFVIDPAGTFDENDEHVLWLVDGASGEIGDRLDLPGRPAQIQGSMIVTPSHVYIDTFGKDGHAIIIVDPSTLAVVGSWAWNDGGSNIRELLPLP